VPAEICAATPKTSPHDWCLGCPAGCAASEPWHWRAPACSLLWTGSLHCRTALFKGPGACRSSGQPAWSASCCPRQRQSRPCVRSFLAGWKAIGAKPCAEMPPHSGTARDAGTCLPYAPSPASCGPQGVLALSPQTQDTKLLSSCYACMYIQVLVCILQSHIKHMLIHIHAYTVCIHPGSSAEP